MPTKEVQLSDEGRYKAFMGMGDAIDYDRYEATSSGNAGRGVGSYLNAAVQARFSKLGDEKVADAAEKACDASFRIGTACYNNGDYAMSVNGFASAIAVATHYKLSKEMIEKARVELAKAKAANIEALRGRRASQPCEKEHQSGPSRLLPDLRRS